MINKLISISIFGAFGGILRYVIQIEFDFQNANFPFALVLINVAGSLFLGLLTGGLLRILATSEAINLGLTTGLLGGFTTFSTFELTTLELFNDVNLTVSLLFILFSIILSVLMANWGQFLGQYLLNHYRKNG